MLKRFKQDVARWVIPQSVVDLSLVTFKTTLRLLWNHMPVRAMLWFRFGSWCKRKRFPVLPGIIQRQIYKHYGLELSVSQEIGGGLYIAHPIGTVISVEKLGQNCTIIASVTIGMRNEWAFPRIGDNVFIGAGARVLGGIEVGDGAVIGANAVVIDDVPAGATVVGIPARVVKINSKKVESNKDEDQAIGVRV
jgi:serine O-acetyltransferase